MFTPLFSLPTSRARFTGVAPLHSPASLLRHFDALLAPRARGSTSGPAFDVLDEGEQFVLRADLPGFGAEDLELEATEDGLTVAGRRTMAVPEGFTAHRQERTGLAFRRSFRFSDKLDPDKISAQLDDGVLTITLAKRAAAAPRSITVRSAAA